LGFKRAPGPTTPGGGTNVWLFDGNGFPLVHVSRPPEGEPPRPAELKSRLDHVAFNCTDPEGFATRLDAEGVPYTVSQLQSAGIKQFNLFDPNGIKVELTFRL
ncbi:MAG: glyoxalase/bleomycin resistance protein/dioxygenase, partial [Caulobacteraceae bacterium]|nr:glyoxalase/bleomycin resistance protein/dioxygenase [Caulobacteraceae bacterium]